MKWIMNFVTSFFWREIKKRGNILVRKNTLEWLLERLLNKNYNIEKFNNNTILRDYRIELIKPNDVVLDIGAGAGLYSLLASLVAKKVYCIEPIIKEVLRKNITECFYHNKFKILPYAFGKNGSEKCVYWGKEIIAKSKNLNYILNKHMDITIIKCDCEGAEWNGFLSTRDFKKIRLIDLEYHLKNNNKRPLEDLISLLETNGFDISLKKLRNSIGLLYAQKIC
jgi:hypothetical protein